MEENKDKIIKKYNLQYLKYSNKTILKGEYDFQSFKCYWNDKFKIDYLLNYSHLSEKDKHENVCLCFFEDDYKFDGKSGIYNSLMFEDKKFIKEFSEKIKDINFIVEPQISVIGNAQKGRNIGNVVKGRDISLKLIYDFNKIMIPTLHYWDEESISYCLDGIEETEIIAISTIGAIRRKEDRRLLSLAIDETLTRLKNLKYVLIYTDLNRVKINLYFKKYIEKGMKLIIPNNRNLEFRHKYRG